MGEGEGGARPLSPERVYRIELRPAARRSIAALPREAQVRIASAIDSLATGPRPPGVTKLRGPEGFYRVRVGDYRIVYAIDDDVLLVLVVAVGHRREVYR